MFIITALDVYLKRCEINVYKSRKARVSNLVRYITIKIEYENTHCFPLSNRIGKIMSAGVTHCRRGRKREKALMAGGGNLAR